MDKVETSKQGKIMNLTRNILINFAFLALAITLLPIQAGIATAVLVSVFHLANTFINRYEVDVQLWMKFVAELMGFILIIIGFISLVMVMFNYLIV